MPRAPLAISLVLAAASCGAAVVPTATAPAPAGVGAPALLWSRGGCEAWGCDVGWYASPAVADLDGDPATKEVVWGAHDLVALRADGSVLWRAEGGARVWASPAVADLTGDGRPELVVARDGGVTVHGPGGAVLWTAAFGPGELRTLAIADLEGDGAPEVLAGRAAQEADGQVMAWRGANGAPVPGFPARHAGAPGYGWGMFHENLAAADLDGDGALELVAPTDVHYVTVLDHRGEQVGVNPRFGAGKVWSEVGVHLTDAVDLRGYAVCGVDPRPNFSDSSPVVADLDGDGTPEVVLVGNVYDCGTDPYRDLYEVPFVFRADRTRFAAGGFDWSSAPAPAPGAAPRSEDYRVIEDAMPAPAVADLDGDGRKEVVYASYDGRVHAYSLDRTEHGSWPFRLPGAGTRFASEPAVVDLDGDGKAEVIVGTWGEKARREPGQLLVLDHLGRLVFAVDLPPAADGGWNGALGAPTVANVDADPDLEIAVGTAAAGVALYRVPGTAHARVLWGTGRGGFARSGTLAR
ncbi:MAG: VCBS repeat-containing protein [Anaeromyxobacteraceae bacterium]